MYLLNTKENSSLFVNQIEQQTIIYSSSQIRTGNKKNGKTERERERNGDNKKVMRKWIEWKENDINANGCVRDGWQPNLML